MRASSVALIVLGGLVIGAGGCRTREGTLVAITVTAASTMNGVESLSVRASVTPPGGTREDRMFTLSVPGKTIPPDVVFGVEVPGDRRGTFEVEVAARNSSGGEIASSSASGELVPGTTVQLSVALAAGTTDMRGADLPAGDLPIVDASGNDLAGSDLATADLFVPMCATSSECPPSAPVCGSGGACRACIDGSDDATCAARGENVCVTAGANAGQCGACNPTSPDTQSPKCPMGSPICTAMGTCTTCTSHAQCASTICDLPTGACIPPASVAFVENNLAICNNTLHDSTPPNAPYCEITSALSAGKAYIRVAGAATAYQRLNFTDQLTPNPLTIMGPGQDAAVPARIFGKLFNGITVNYTSAAIADATLVVDGLVIGGTDSTNRGDQGIRCTNASSFKVGVVVRNSRIEHNGQWGIWGSNCDVDIGTSTISANEGPALEVSGGTSSIRRTRVINNPGGGIVKQGGGKLDAANVLVAGNGIASVASLSGIRATGGTITIANATVVRNLSNSSLLSGVNGNGSTCAMLNTVVTEEAGEENVLGCSAGFSAWNGASTANDNFELADCDQATLFTNWAGYDFHLSLGAALCSLVNIGGVSFGGVTAPSQDIEGTMRPLQGANDIGAYERP